MQWIPVKPAGYAIDVPNLVFWIVVGCVLTLGMVLLVRWLRKSE